MKEIQFVKMHGLGNDFVILDGRQGTLFNYSGYASAICNRRTGIGCDQLLVLSKSQKAQAFMNIFNSDGSRAEMCGNGIRCVAAFLKQRDLIKDKYVWIDSPAGVKQVSLYSERDAEVDMGEPMFDPAKIPAKSKTEIINKSHEINNIEYRISSVSLGNPHCVIVGDDGLLSQISTLGPVIETDPLFPKKTNVEFVKVLDRGRMKLKVWERGAGETRACGSGASAAMVIARRLNLVDDSVKVLMPGGELSIKWEGTGSVFMRGKVSYVYKGSFNIEDLEE